MAACEEAEVREGAAAEAADEAAAVAVARTRTMYKLDRKKSDIATDNFNSAVKFFFFNNGKKFGRSF
jgi:hypothetical protein